MALQVLVVDGSPGDVRQIGDTLRASRVPIRLHVAADGVEAMAFLTHQDPYGSAPRPGLILLELDLPGMDGREVLARIKTDDRASASLRSGPPLSGELGLR
jgi:chemotaxis family two-component system response regulator Rcp1